MVVCVTVLSHLDFHSHCHTGLLMPPLPLYPSLTQQSEGFCSHVLSQITTLHFPFSLRRKAEVLSDPQALPDFIPVTPLCSSPRILPFPSLHSCHKGCFAATQEPWSHLRTLVLLFPLPVMPFLQIPTWFTLLPSSSLY